MARFHLDYNEYQFADLIDRCRGPTATLRAFVGHDFLEMKPDTMTLCPTWLDQARSALFPDTGTINTDDIRSRMSAWNSYLQSKSGYSNLAEIDRFKLINHILVHEVRIILENFLSSTHSATGSSPIPGKHSVRSPQPGTKSLIWNQPGIIKSQIFRTVRQRISP